MEALTGRTWPASLKLAHSTLVATWQLHERVQEHKAQSEHILRRCLCILLEIQLRMMSGTISSPMTNSIHSLEKLCLDAKSIVSELASKGLAWHLLYRDEILHTLRSLEESGKDVCVLINFEGEGLQEGFVDARERDQADTIAHLSEIANDDDLILDELQEGDDEEQRYTLEELVVAFTKHTEGFGPIANDRIQLFVSTATAVLQLQSRRPISRKIPSWNLTTLEVLYDRHDKESQLESTSCGLVFRGKLHGELVVVREVPVQTIHEADSNFMSRLHQELGARTKLSHPHILPFLGASLESKQPFLTFKFYPNGNALEYLRSFPHADRLGIMYEVGLGMHYLHNHDIIHGDVRAAKILVGEDGKAVISDFASPLEDVLGMSSAGESSKRRPALRWRAPELFGDVPVDKRADVYSFGVAAWELYTREVPYADVTDARVQEFVAAEQGRPKRPAELRNEAVWKLLEQCWDADPAVRPPFWNIHYTLKPFAVKLETAAEDGDAESVYPESAISTAFSLSFNEFPVEVEESWGDEVNDLLSGTIPKTKGLKLLQKRMFESKAQVYQRSSISTSGTSEQSDPRASAGSLSDGLPPVSEDDPGIPFADAETVSSLVDLAKSEKGRAELLSQPPVLSSIVDLLSDQSLNVTQKALHCLYSLADSKGGVQALLSQRNFFAGILVPHTRGSPAEKREVANLLGRIASIDEGKAALLKQYTFRPVLVDVFDPGRKGQYLENTPVSDVIFLRSLSQTQAVDHVRIMRRQLAAPGLGAEKIPVVSAMRVFLATDKGRKAILSEPGVLSSMQVFLSYGTLDLKEYTLAYLADLAFYEKGKEPIIECTDVLPLMSKLLVSGSSGSREHAARCLSNLASSSSGRGVVLVQSDILPTLANLITFMSSCGEKEQLVDCLYTLGLCAEGKTALIAQPGIVKGLRELLFHESIKVHMQAARCLGLLYKHDRASLEAQLDEDDMMSSSRELLSRWQGVTDDTASCFLSLVDDINPSKLADNIPGQPFLLVLEELIRRDVMREAALSFLRTLSTCRPWLRDMSALPKLLHTLSDVMRDKSDVVCPELATTCLRRLAETSDSHTLLLTDVDMLHQMVVCDIDIPTTKAALDALYYLTQTAPGKQAVKQHSKLVQEIGRLATSNGPVHKEAKACLHILGFQSQAKAWARLVVQNAPKLGRRGQALLRLDTLRP